MNLKNFSLGQLLNGTVVFSNEDYALAESIGEVLKYVYEQTSKIDYQNEIPDFLLDHVAVCNHVDFYDSSFPNEIKRSLIENSDILHEIKGTPAAIELALESFKLKGEVIEWFDYNADPYHFLVEFALKNNLKQIDDVKKMIIFYKNERSVFDGIVIILTTDSIILTNGTYSYPIYYPETGEFYGEKNFAQLDVGAINQKDDAYSYEVEYPVSEKVVSILESETTNLVDGGYNYPKRFFETGEMSTLMKSVSMQESTATSREENYGYKAIYPICGEMETGGDWQ